MSECPLTIPTVIYNRRTCSKCGVGLSYTESDPCEKCSAIIADAQEELAQAIYERVAEIPADCRDGNLSPVDINAAIRSVCAERGIELRENKS